jgi:signal transduction histidine kinase
VIVGGERTTEPLSRGKVMNEPSACTCRADAIVEEVDRRASGPELGGETPDADPAEILQLDTRELNDNVQILPALSGPELGSQTGPNNEFVTVLSHELRNSLGAICSATDILSMETSASPTAVKARTLIERQAGQMRRLVEDLLDVSRVRSGRLRLRCEHVDLCAVAAHAAQTVEFTMLQCNQRLTTSLPDTPVRLQADPYRLQQVFVNLLLNAAKYSDPGGSVWLSVEQEEGEAIVRVRDTGIGIAPDVLPRVFDFFVQADTSSRHADAGLGIGLTLVRSLVECHGGSVAVASAGLQQGSEFTVRLPTRGGV